MKLSPPPKEGISIAKLVGLLASLPRLDKDSTAMAKDMKTVRNKAGLPVNPWA